jgi:hypothetical protein
VALQAGIQHPFTFFMIVVYAAIGTDLTPSSKQCKQCCYCAIPECTDRGPDRRLANLINERNYVITCQIIVLQT